jgi:glutaconate CoA-transferase subunit B
MSVSYNTTDVMAVSLAREFRDREVVVMGAVPALPLLACRLAKSLHAPSLSYVVGGSGTVNPQLPVLTTQSCDPRLAGGPCALPLPEVVLLEGRGDVFDVFCAGGLQIDAHGNCNLVCVGDRSHPKLRGPGSVGLPFLTSVQRVVAYSLSHTPRTFVEHVDFVSGRGDRTALVVTPLACLEKDPETGRLRLASVHPGVSAANVQAQTGFELVVPAEVPETSPPTEAELAELRRLDPTGVLAN